MNSRPAEVATSRRAGEPVDPRVAWTYEPGSTGSTLSPASAVACTGSYFDIASPTSRIILPCSGWAIFGKGPVAFHQRASACSLLGETR